MNNNFKNYVSLSPYVNKIKKNQRIPGEFVEYLAKILKTVDESNKNVSRAIKNRAYNKIIEKYANNRNLGKNELIRIGTTIITATKQEVNRMKNYTSFKEYVKTFSPADVNNKNMVTPRAEKALRPLWNMSRLPPPPPPSSSKAPVVVGVGLGAIAVTAVALLLTGKI